MFSQTLYYQGVVSGICLGEDFAHGTAHHATLPKEDGHVMWALLLGFSCKGLDAAPIFAGNHCAASREVEVQEVLDGDTIQVPDSEGATISVRMLGVDADEIAHNESETAECWGDEAFAWTAALLTGQTVRLDFDEVCEDKYGRTLAYVWLPEMGDNGNDLLVNEDIIRQGQAVVYEDFDNIRWADILYTAEAYAKSSGLGLWSECQ